MLDYLKESSATGKEQQATAPNTAGDSGLASEGYITTTAQDTTVKRGTYLLVMLIVLGLGGLWFMAKKAKPQSAIAKGVDNKSIETAIAQMTGTKAEFFKEINGVVTKFNEIANVKQVKVNELQKNPFNLEEFAADSGMSSEDSEAYAKQREQMDLQQSARKMQLLSIIKSPAGNRCMIDDKIVGRGETIKGWTVEEITDDGVLLKAGDLKVALKFIQ